MLMDLRWRSKVIKLGLDIIRISWSWSNIRLGMQVQVNSWRNVVLLMWEKDKPLKNYTLWAPLKHLLTVLKMNKKVKINLWLLLVQIIMIFLRLLILRICRCLMINNQMRYINNKEKLPEKSCPSHSISWTKTNPAPTCLLINQVSN